MRAAPPVSVAVVPSRPWLHALTALVVATVAAVSVWTWTRRDLLSGMALLLTIPYAGWLRWQAGRTAPQHLRWDGQGWHLGASEPDGAAAAGELHVAIDLGPLLLLRFVGRWTGRRRTVWLAVSRRETGSDWHALRCAVHARPMAPDRAPAHATADDA